MVELVLFTYFNQNSDGDRAVEMALSCPDNFVMKPQREGGGLSSILRLRYCEPNTELAVDLR